MFFCSVTSEAVQLLVDGTETDLLPQLGRVKYRREYQHSSQGGECGVLFQKDRILEQGMRNEGNARSRAASQAIENPSARISFGPESY